MSKLVVKNLSAKQETWVQFLGQEEPLEKGMATHSSTLAWRIPWTEEPGRLQSMGSYRVGHDRATNSDMMEKPNSQPQILLCADEVLETMVGMVAQPCECTLCH